MTLADVAREARVLAAAIEDYERAQQWIKNFRDGKANLGSVRVEWLASSSVPGYQIVSIELGRIIAAWPDEFLNRVSERLHSRMMKAQTALQEALNAEERTVQEAQYTGGTVAGAGGTSAEPTR